MNLAPPPTFALPILVDEATGKAIFNPIWLDWFLRFSAVINAAGGDSLAATLNQASPILSLGGSADSSSDDAMVIPGPQGPRGLTGIPFVASGEDGIDGDMGPPGVPGLGTSAWSSWTPTRTGWTDVGSPTVTARYSVLGQGVCLFQVKVVPGTTVATTAGTSYISLPITANTVGISGDASMQDTTTLISIGNCTFDVANSRCYVPTQVATGDTLVIAGWYEI